MRRHLLAAALFALPLPALAAPVPVDLTSWDADGGMWSLAPDNLSVIQTTNSPTGVFHTGVNDIGRRFTGTIGVEGDDDDDFIGFVLGYNDGNLDAATGTSPVDYILIDWKGLPQTVWDAGMAASRVTDNIYSIGGGAAATGSDAWTHTGDVDFITRSNAPGSVFANAGWVPDTVYDFTIDFTPDRIRVEIDGNLEIDLTPSDAGLTEFSPGSFGFYGFSQPNSRYAELEQQPSPFFTPDPSPPSPVPVPASLPLVVAGLGSLVWMRRRRKAV